MIVRREVLTDGFSARRFIASPAQLKAEIIAYLTRPLLMRSDKSSKMRNSDAGSVKN